MNVLELFKHEEIMEFSQGIGSLNKETMGDRLFPDIKTQNLQATFFQLSDGLQIPTMAQVHAFDAEAKIGSRPTIEAITIEKFLVKEKINLTELEREYKKRGVMDAPALKEFLFNDFGILAQSVKTRFEVAKMELLYSGKMTVKENKLNYTIGNGLEIPKQSKDWSSADADIIGDIGDMIALAEANGYVITKIITSKKILAKMRANKGIQTALFGAAGVGTNVTLGRLKDYLLQEFNVSVETNDALYRIDADTTKRYIPENKFILVSEQNGIVGRAIWGVTPEEEVQGIWTAKSSQQYITLTGWATQDPVVEWFKASGLAVPFMYNTKGHVVADIKLA